MNWYDKESAYEQKYRNGTVATDLWKYIPQSKMQGVKDAFSDSDGYWIFLDHEEGNWFAYDAYEDGGIIHEYTIADLKNAIKTIRKVER